MKYVQRVTKWDRYGLHPVDVGPMHIVSEVPALTRCRARISTQSWRTGYAPATCKLCLRAAQPDREAREP